MSVLHEIELLLSGMSRAEKAQVLLLRVTLRLPVLRDV
jgi:hypothetical protein